MLISVQCIKLDESKSSNRTFVREYPETLSYSIFLISGLSHFTTLNLASTVFFSFYSRLPSLFEIAPDISKTQKNGATCVSTVLYFDFYTKYQTASEFHYCYGNQWLFRTQSNIYDCTFFAKIVNSFQPLTISAKNPSQIFH